MQSTKPEVHIATPAEQDGATATDNMYKNLSKFARVALESCLRRDRQTDTHAYHYTPLSYQDRRNQ